MRRIVPAVLALAALIALPVQAQQHAHTVAMPELQVHGVGPTDLRFINPADDPRKKN